MHVHLEDVLNQPIVEQLHDLAADFRGRRARVFLVEFPQLALEKAMFLPVSPELRIAMLLQERLLAGEMGVCVVDQDLEDPADGGIGLPLCFASSI